MTDAELDELERQFKRQQYLAGPVGELLAEVRRLRAEPAALARLGAWLAASKRRRCHVEASNRHPGRPYVTLMDHGDEGPTVVVCGYPAPDNRSGEDRTCAVWLFIDTADVGVLMAAALDEWERTRGGGA